MTSTPPTNPYHLSRAYGLQTAPVVQPSRAVAKTIDPVGIEAAGVREQGTQRAGDKLARVVAATVAGSVDFDGLPAVAGDENAPVAREALPFYRHPADRVAAATAVNAGRLIDVRG